VKRIVQVRNGVCRLLLLLGLLPGPACWAQLLVDNTVLNPASIARWMQSNRDMAPVMQQLDGLNTSAEAMAAFDALPASQQDERINHYLQQAGQLDSAQRRAQLHGWKSVGEYMRLSTRLGNAIAAYFSFGGTQNLPAEELQALRAKADPALLKVPASDVAFVKANETLLRAYIQAYAAGRQ